MKFKEHFKQITGDPRNGAYSKALAYAMAGGILFLMMMIAAIEVAHFIERYF